MTIRGYNPRCVEGSKFEQHTTELEERFKGEARTRHMQDTIQNVDAYKLSPEKVQKIYDIIKGD